MRRRAVLLLALLAASCQQGEAGRSSSIASQLAAWEATEARLDAEARELSPKLQRLARSPGNEAVVEAYEALEAARQTLHKTRVTMANDLAAPQPDPAAAEQLQRSAEERMTAAIQRLEKRISVARTLATSAATAAPPTKARDKAEPEKLDTDEPANAAP